MYPQQASRPQVQPGRIRLSIGASGGVKVFVAIVGALAIVIMLLFVAITWFAGSFVSDFTGHVDTHGPVAPGDPAPDISGAGSVAGTVLRGAGLCAVPFAVLFAFVVLRVLRGAGWLEGTTAVLRGAVSTRRVDLATAAVRGDVVTHSETRGNWRYYYSVAAVAARDPATGKEIKIPLRGQGLKRLPAMELQALANAIMARRHPADPSYAEAAAVASALQQMAANPFPV
jgi:hypothetical protein